MRSYLAIPCAIALAIAAACGGIVSPGDSNGSGAPPMDAGSAVDVAAPVGNDAAVLDASPPPCIPGSSAEEYYWGKFLLQYADAGDDFTRLNDFLGFFQEIALASGFVDPLHHVDCSAAGLDAGECDYDPRQPRLNASDIHYSDAYDRFIAPDGQPYIWMYIQDRNEFIAADANLSPQLYDLILQYEMCFAQDH